MHRISFLFFVAVIFSNQITFGQSENRLSFFEPADSLNKKRLLTISFIGATTYTASIIALNEFWYKDFERESFHTFNDWGEWENMDKFGHAYSAYFQSKLFYEAARWTGMTSTKSAIAAFTFSTLAQTSIEYLDSKSSKWGWSWYDVAFNTGGSLLFTVQEVLWSEQKCKLKFSYTPVKYSGTAITKNSITSSIKDRAQESFGDGFAERLVKDYNAQTIWLSMNLKSVFALKSSKFPAWFNIAVGYGAQNMLGALGNGWSRNNVNFNPSEDYNRFRQLYISFDIDLERLPIKNKVLRGVFKVLNIIKIPSPTLEFNTRGEQVFHLLYF